MQISKKLSQKVLTTAKMSVRITIVIRKSEVIQVTVNINRLIGKMYEKGYNKTSFANELEISRETLRAYINKPQNMPYSIIEKSISLLGLNSDEAKDIFFAQ